MFLHEFLSVNYKMKAISIFLINKEKKSLIVRGEAGDVNLNAVEDEINALKKQLESFDLECISVSMQRNWFKQGSLARYRIFRYSSCSHKIWNGPGL
jgi:hypothetical protein